jgi:hypothetical protein
MEEALETIGEAAKQDPSCPRAAFGLAQIAFECWQPAADLFASARRLVPSHPDVIRNHALAMAAEGQNQAAETLLDQALQASPGWIDGHRTLATLRITNGQLKDADASYITANASVGTNIPLIMAWFQHYVALKQWRNAGEILRTAMSEFPEHRQLKMAMLFLDSEGSEAVNLEHRFEAFSHLKDPGFDLCHVRYLLRSEKYHAAEAIAFRHVGAPSERMFWPYLSLCWRLTGNARAEWLDGSPLFSSCIDLNSTAAELASLTKVLRGLHRLKAPYPEQSVRGGTQTDRQIFFHPDSDIQKIRLKVQAAVRTYLASLPPLDPSHPLYGRQDAPILFEGSWSVLLRGSGFHAPHTHIHGWISSAFYVAVPPRDQMGAEPAGGLSLGLAPRELAVPLPAYRTIAPTAGQLVLFPSTMWHGTEAIESGERLTIAFDVRRT